MDRISLLQAVVILTSTNIGVGSLILPRSAVEKMGTPDAWIAVILGGLLVILASLIITNLNRRFPGQTFYQYSHEIVGKWLGSLLSLSLVTYLIVFAAFELRIVGQVTQFYLLDGTPIEFIIMTMMWVGVYLVIDGINPLARVCVILFPITLVIFLLIMCLSIKVLEVDHLRPVLGLGILPVIKGIPSTFLSYSGFEFMLIWLAFMKQPQKAGKAASLGTLISMILYVITTVVVIGGLSVNETKKLLWPTVEVIRQYELMGLVFERFETFLLAVWIMQIFTTFAICYYLASLGLAQLFRKKLNSCSFFLLPIIYIVAMYPENINDILKLGDMIGYTAFFFGGALPIILLCITLLRRKRYGNASP
ncbi:GerAB/ArcD/ProY family transporter [Metabacillus arenae]|uniref:GerAB/ArcD/ProY family transporter n=1 Tax=Metabacillus arenae TaxID=2771434 RepID=A0A926RZF6_9BACI|nr:GerAB/ArcD/ProY family transporter [Metabacillus arenae]MBD1382202.1 GerAB/ArcD/ProY family transporter [Metabacillus arenae]